MKLITPTGTLTLPTISASTFIEFVKNGIEVQSKYRIAEKVKIK